MQPENGSGRMVDYAGTGKTRPENPGQHDRPAGRHDGMEPKVLVEIIVVEGAEGQTLHAMQAEIIRRVLMRLAEKQVRGIQEGSRP